MRELTGGVYFGEPKEIVTLETGEKRAVDTQVYTEHEIERIARVAFDLARTRGKRVASAEKRNVMKSGVLWNEVVTRVHSSEYSDIELTHILADNCAMQLVRWPKQFDVIVTDNLFGDILSDARGDADRLSGDAAFRVARRKRCRMEKGLPFMSRFMAARPILPAGALQIRSRQSRASVWRFATRSE